MPDALLDALYQRARRYFPPGEDGDDPMPGTAGMFFPQSAGNAQGMKNAIADWREWRDRQDPLSPEDLALAFAGPLRAGGLGKARGILQALARGERPRREIIGDLTPQQFRDINAARTARGMPPLSSPEVAYNGRHHYNSRAGKDGDGIPEMLTQIERSMDAGARVEQQNRGPALVNPTPRVNPRGETVRDQAVLEGGDGIRTLLLSAYGKQKRFPTPQGMSGSTPASGSPEPVTRAPPASGPPGPVKPGTPGSNAILPPGLLNTSLGDSTAAAATTDDQPTDIRSLLMRSLLLQDGMPVAR